MASNATENLLSHCTPELLLLSNKEMLVRKITTGAMGNSFSLMLLDLQLRKILLNDSPITQANSRFKLKPIS